MSFLKIKGLPARTALISFLISLFGTLFLWQFWSHDTHVLGVNATVYGWLFLAFFVYLRRPQLRASSLAWLAPLAIICLGIGLYSNTFTKGISVFLLPFLFFIFSTHEAHPNTRKSLWSRFMPLDVITHGVNYLGCAFRSPSYFSFEKKVNLNIKVSHEKKSMAKQVLWGVLIFLILAGLIIIPLLSSADSQFAELFSGLANFLESIWSGLWKFIKLWFGENFVAKVLLTFIGMMLLLGLALYWGTEVKANPMAEKNTDFGQRNAVSIGIVLGGILGLYAIFLVLQIKNLFVGALPIEFAQTERLVKTGFWQLFMLTLINILFYVGLYQKSTKTVQRILGSFSFASLLLVFSAAHRMYLYVTNYGLSYEKFYAFYTVIFCIGVFVWFVYLFMRDVKSPQIIKILAFASLWMYALTAILPLDHIILFSNFNLTQQSNSRVNVNELKMLSYDVAPWVEANFEKIVALGQEDEEARLNNLKRLGISQEEIDRYQRRDVQADWQAWLNSRQSEANFRSDRNNRYLNRIEGNQKRWYEKSLSELIN